MTNYKAMNAYLLVTSLNLTLYAIAELEPTKMKQAQKLKFMSLRNANKNFLDSILKSKEDKELLNEQSFESIGLIIEIVAMLSQVHPEQHEWIMEEVKKLIFISVNRQNGAMI